MQKRIENLLKEIAVKYDKPLYVIEEIFLSQFKLTAETMRSLEFKTIKLPNFGKFIASKSKISKIDVEDKINKQKLRYGSSYKGNKNNPIQGTE